jgi:hypothetical protein
VSSAHDIRRTSWYDCTLPVSFSHDRPLAQVPKLLQLQVTGWRLRLTPCRIVVRSRYGPATKGVATGDGAFDREDRPAAGAPDGSGEFDEVGIRLNARRDVERYKSDRHGKLTLEQTEANKSSTHSCQLPSLLCSWAPCHLNGGCSQPASGECCIAVSEVLRLHITGVNFRPADSLSH